MRTTVLMLALIVLGVAAQAEERALGIQTYGDGVAAPVTLAPDQAVSSGSGLAQVRLLDAPGSVLTLGPGTVLRLQRRETPAGESLVIALESGTVQVSIADKGRYADVHVIGGAVDARVTGTLFVVERTRRDSDYVALVRGKLTVRMRQELSEALAAGAKDHVDLDSRQGVGGGPGGLGSIDTLTGRPQLGAHTSSIKEQGTGGLGGWDEDVAQGVIDGSVLPPPTEGLGDDISSHVADIVGTGIETQINNEIINQTLGGNGILGPPPGPP